MTTRMSALIVCDRCGHRHHGHTVEADADPRDIFDDLGIVLSGEITSLGVEKICAKCQKPVLTMPSAKTFVVYEATR